MRKWGSSGRVQGAVERLGADLSNHGLRTEPDFLKVGIDVEVAILLSLGEAELPAATRTPSMTSDLEDSVLPEVGLTLGNIPSANKGVTSVKPGSSLEEAVTLMLLNDYSQVAIMSNERSVQGAVTWQSIAQSTARAGRRRPQGGVQSIRSSCPMTRNCSGFWPSFNRVSSCLSGTRKMLSQASSLPPM